MSAGMTAGTNMSLVCGRNRSRRRMTEYQEAGCSVPEDGCSNWKRTPADIVRHGFYPPGAVSFVNH